MTRLSQIIADRFIQLENRAAEAVETANARYARGEDVDVPGLVAALKELRDFEKALFSLKKVA